MPILPRVTGSGSPPSFSVPVLKGRHGERTEGISVMAPELRSPHRCAPENVTESQMVKRHYRYAQGVQAGMHAPLLYWTSPCISCHTTRNPADSKKMYQNRFGSVSTSIITGRLWDIAVTSAFLRSSGRLTRIPIPPHTSAYRAKSGLRRSVA